MQKQTLSHNHSGYLNNLVLDYINGNDFTKQFYSVFPDVDSLLSLSVPENFTHINRSVLVSVLEKQNQNLPLTNAVKENIAALASDNCYCVVTAHQLNIFTGPIYTIYKTVSTIKSCIILNKQKPEAHFVPVFYLGSEDHDFNEINHFHLFNNTISWTNDVAGPCGRLSTTGLEKVLEDVQSVLGTGIHAGKILNIFKEAYSTNKTLAQATRFILNAIFGAYGLVVIDGDDAQLKAMSKEVMLNELLHNSSFHLVEQTNSILKTRYHEQAHAREINLFYLEDGIRERIAFDANTQKFQVLNTDLSFTKEAIAQLVDMHPEKLSPNVILRPLFQQQVLPALAYVGGGGELSYWLQLQSVFNFYKVPFPALMLRNSVLLIEQSTQKKIQKLNLLLADLFLDEPALIKKYVLNKSGDEISLSKQREVAESIFLEIAERAKAVDTTLEKSVNAEKQNLLNALDRLEAKILKARKNNLEVEVNQIKFIKHKIFPDNIPQERFENLMQWYVKYGDLFIETLVKYLEPFDTRLTILIEA